MAWMEQKPIICDPKGDTYIVLYDPVKEFAVWKTHTQSCAKPRPAEEEPVSNGFDDDPWASPPWASPATNETAKRFKGQTSCRKAARNKPITSYPSEEKNSASTNLFTSGLLGVEATDATTTCIALKSQRGEEGNPQTLKHNSTEDISEAIIFRVSSRHLVLASPWFEISQDFKEGCQDKDGLYHVEAHDWDVEAFRIFLDILHLHNRMVPREVSLEMLAKFAMLVDYYRCWEAVEMFTNSWIDSAKRAYPLPSTYGRDLVLWMFVSWVFDLPDVFKQTTAIAIHQCETPTLDTLELPIPAVIVDEIEIKRYQGLDAVFSTCCAWLDKFCDDYECEQGEEWTFSCGSILLGALTKQLHRLGYLSPRPEIPFDGKSFEHVCQRVRAMKSPRWCHEYSRNGYDTQHNCSFSDTILPCVDAISNGLTGLDLRKFMDRGKEKCWSSYRG